YIANGNRNLNGNGNLVAVRAEGNAVGHNGYQIRCYNCKGLGIQLQAEEFDLMAAAADLDEIKEVNANCILMANLQQASTSGEKLYYMVTAFVERVSFCGNVIRVIRLKIGEKSGSSRVIHKLGIIHHTLTARKPQQNSVVKRINHTLVEAARIMLIFSKSPEFLWAKAIATAFLLGIALSYIHVSKEDLDNLFGHMYEEYYATRSPEVSDNSAVNTLNKEDTPSSSLIVVEENEAPQVDLSNMHELHQKHRFIDRWTKNHLIEQVIGDPSKHVTTRSRLNTNAEMCMYALTVATTEPTNIKEAMLDHSWIELMQDELNQLKRSDMWELIARPTDRNVNNVKWLWKNKSDVKNTVI
nr:hypothetical protein [Tanacetum cinerariifolium]